MSKYAYKVSISLKNGVVDPQGESVKKVLLRSGYNIGNVRFGKVIDVEIEAGNKEMADKKIEEIADKILANPVLENYSIESGE
jgi:phosphoribosylformylglycinamidine synthase PurS subunit